MCTKKDRCIFERETGFHLMVTDIYVDGDGHESEMRWIPKFQACRALSRSAAASTPSGTIGDWFAPKQVKSDWILGKDYEPLTMGGYWVDMWLNSAHDATRKSRGTTCSGEQAYVSQRGVAPMTDKTIAHFRKHLSDRFEQGGFAGSGGYGIWSGKGGLITDQHWFELWIWSRINHWHLRGNTNGYNAKDHIPVWHGNPNETGILDESWPSSYGLSITGSGPRAWDIPVGDICGNRWEFVDGLRLKDSVIFSSGKTVNPWTNPEDGYKHKAFINTGLSISGVESRESISSYRTEDGVKLHGIPASTTEAGKGGFDGQGFWYWKSGETIAVRGGSNNAGPRCPGALPLVNGPWSYYYDVAARAVLVP